MASGQELNSWYEEGMDAEDYETVCIGEGYTMKMTQLAVCNSDGMCNQAKLDLQVSKVNYLQPEKMDLTDYPDAKVSGGEHTAVDLYRCRFHPCRSGYNEEESGPGVRRGGGDSVRSVLCRFFVGKDREVPEMNPVRERTLNGSSCT